MFTPDIVPHVGRYCEVATRNGRLFGELVRLSAASFLVRSKWPAIAVPKRSKPLRSRKLSTSRILVSSLDLQREVPLARKKRGSITA